MKFRKKPVIIDAWQLTVQWIEQQHTVDPKKFEPKDTPDGQVSVLDCYMYEVTNKIYFMVYENYLNVFVRTLEGDHKANVGDWIITGVKGEQYPCKPNIFEMTYEKV